MLLNVTRGNADTLAQYDQSVCNFFYALAELHSNQRLPVDGGSGGDSGVAGSAGDGVAGSAGAGGARDEDSGGGGGKSGGKDGRQCDEEQVVGFNKAQTALCNVVCVCLGVRPCVCGCMSVGVWVCMVGYVNM